jgi:hypothetical protein
MDEHHTGMLIVAAGACLVLVGLLVAAGGFGWFGRLPGDLHFGNGNVRVYAPLASMLLISVVLSVLMALLRRF